MASGLDMLNSKEIPRILNYMPLAHMFGCGSIVAMTYLGTFCSLSSQLIGLFFSVQVVKSASGRARSTSCPTISMLFNQQSLRWFLGFWTNSTTRFARNSERKACLVASFSGWQSSVNWRWFDEATSRRTPSGTRSFSTKSGKDLVVRLTVWSRPVHPCPVKCVDSHARPSPASSSNRTGKQNVSSDVRKQSTISNRVKLGFPHRSTTSNWSMFLKKITLPRTGLERYAFGATLCSTVIWKMTRRRGRPLIRMDGCTRVISDDGHLTKRWLSSIERKTCIKSVSFPPPILVSISLLQLSQGEYVAPEKIEDVYARSRFISQIFVYGDSLESCLVAIVLLNDNTVKKWAASEGAAVGPAGSPEFNAKLQKAILQDMAVEGKRRGLLPFEAVKGIEFIDEAFTIENGLMTPTFKARRYAVEKKYKELFQKIYKRVNAWEALQMIYLFHNLFLRISVAVITERNKLSLLPTLSNGVRAKGSTLALRLSASILRSHSLQSTVKRRV